MDLKIESLQFIVGVTSNAYFGLYHPKLLYYELSFLFVQQKDIFTMCIKKKKKSRIYVID